MTAELTALVLAALLQFGQIILAARSKTRDAGMDYNASPRDADPAFSPQTGRLIRAAANHQENLILFAIAVVAATLSGAAGAVTAVCAWLYLAARILYVPAYVFGWSPWRSLIYGVGLVATLLMLLAALLTKMV